MTTDQVASWAEARRFADIYTAAELAALAYELEYLFEMGELPEDAAIIESAELVGECWMIVHASPDARRH